LQFIESGNRMLPQPIINEPHAFTLSTEEKWKFYQENCNLLKEFNSDQHENSLEWYKKITRLLSILLIVTDPQEQFEIAPHILRLLELMIRKKIIHKVVMLLNRLEEDLLLEAVKIITLLATGPKIPHIPLESIFHPSKMTMKVLLVNDRTIGRLIKLLRTSNKKLKEQIIIALGTIAKYDKEPRDIILMSGSIEALIGCFVEPLDNSMIQKITWTLSIICGETLPKEAALKSGKIAVDVLTTVVKILPKTEDTETMANIFAILKHLLTLVEIRPDNINVWKQLVLRLTYQDSIVRKSSLAAVKNIITLNEIQTQFMLECGLVEQLNELLTSQSEEIRIETCSIISILGQKGHSWVIHYLILVCNRFRYSRYTFQTSLRGFIFTLGNH